MYKVQRCTENGLEDGATWTFEVGTLNPDAETRQLLDSIRASNKGGHTT